MQTDTGASEKKIAARERVRKHREAMRAKGYRQIQRWVLDTRRPEIAEAIRRQCIAIRDDPREKEVFEFMDAVMEGTDWN